MPPVSVLMVAALTGALVVGASTAGRFAATESIKGVKAIHHHIFKPTAHAAKVIAQHQLPKSK